VCNANKIKWLPSIAISVTAVLIALLAVGVTLPGDASDAPTIPRKSHTEQVTTTMHPVTINRPDGPPRVAADERDAMGRAVTVSCASCHATREPKLATRGSDALEEFHQGMKYAHADVTCLTCHNADDYNTLRRADGTTIRYQDVMQLCAQCHGPQTRDYNNGSHGGMTGYWDRTRGERRRNNCIDCHDPHAPAFPVMKPVFPPKDRFLPAGAKSRTHESGAAHE